MDSDLDITMTDVLSSSTTSPAPWNRALSTAWPPASSLASSRYVLRRKGQTHVACPKTANKRGGMSFIWEHGTEFRRKGVKKPDWLCNLCWDKKTIFIEGTSTTSRAIAHLEEIHSINEYGPIPQAANAPATAAMLQASGVRQAGTTIRIVAQVALQAFQTALICWIAIAHIALSCVEVDAFRDLIQLLNPALFEYLYKSGNSIRNLIMKDFEARKGKVKDELARSLSKIHVSFDLWTAPNTIAILGVVVHYLASDLKARSLLIGLKEVEGSHSGENIAATVLPVLQDFELTDRIGYFISDNAAPNDLAVEALCRELKLADATALRLRCLGHIINLSAKAFLYGNDEESFDFEVDEMSAMKFEMRQALELLVFWRKKGPIGKLHNLVLWIRATPQRRQAFRKIATDESEAVNSMSSFSASKLMLI